MSEHVSNGSSERVEDIRYGVEKSIRYHQRRRGFLESCHRYLMFAVILSGSAAFSTALTELVPAEYLALLAAALGAFDLATGISVSARDYAILQGKFSTLLAEIARTDMPTAQLVREWEARRIEIEAEEPPIYWVVEADCDNEICRLRGKDSQAVHISLVRRIFMHLLRQEGFYAARPNSA